MKLLGCCIKGEERILVLEYMPNKSLDSFLFGMSKGNFHLFFNLLINIYPFIYIMSSSLATDNTRRSFLDWERRLEIINGVARGVLYLHQDSRLRIIHRDLKTSNILLDAEMNPKVSDFGMARIIHEDQFQDKTNRVVGT